MEAVKNYISSIGDIGSVTMDITENEIIENEEGVLSIASFCQNIHSEIYEKIDHLFFIQMQGFMDLNYKLNPNEYSLDASTSVTGMGVSLDSLIGDSPVDPILQQEYRNKIQDLSDDEPPKSVKDIMNDSLWQWQGMLNYDDIKEIDRLIYSAQRSIIASDGTVLSADNPMADIFYELSPYLVIKNIDNGGGLLHPFLQRDIYGYE